MKHAPFLTKAAWQPSISLTTPNLAAVALKLPLGDIDSNAERMQRFVQEAKAASALNHPNIITIYEVGEADSVHFIATEFITGDTLRSYLSRIRLPTVEVLDISIQAASAIVAAHAAGILHRDVKPENIMRRHDGIVKLVDFGLAKLQRAEPSSITIDPEAATREIVKTQPGTLLGTTH